MIIVCVPHILVNSASQQLNYMDIRSETNSFSFQMRKQVVTDIYQSQIPLCLRESVFAVGGKSPVIANTTKEF